MGKKDKIIITRPDDFSLVEEELSTAMDALEHVNARVEAFLKEQIQSESGAHPVLEETPICSASDPGQEALPKG